MRPAANHNQSFLSWLRSGDPWIWFTAGAVSISLVMVLGLLLLIAARGLGQFWPAPVAAFQITEPDATVGTTIGQMIDRERVSSARLREQGYPAPEDELYAERVLVKVGNRDLLGSDFRWVPEPAMGEVDYPPDIVVIEREEWGNLYGRLQSIKQDGERVSPGQQTVFEALQDRIERKQELSVERRHIQKDLIGGINYQIEQLRLKKRRLELDNVTDKRPYLAIEEQRTALQSEYAEYNVRLTNVNEAIDRDSAVVITSDGREIEVPLAKMVRAYRPNSMGIFSKAVFYIDKFREFIFDDPREANTEGGIFPAIFGTVLMVVIMSIFVTPFGVVAAVYLREYAHQGLLVRMIRIAVNNLAGVPSVVYGVFGLGFFVYFIGGRIDTWFYPEALPAPTFGTPGLIWSSLTLAILTVPVVIVATEEGLSRIPRAIREGSLALGATQAETLWRTVLPMAAPAMITGLILAVARAAGEVAPLMMVGVVKLAPSLPLDGNFPYLHLERKFMHLGFHIYDVGFQSPNVEAARPLVYATALLLVLVIIVLNLAAIRIRDHLRNKYNAYEN